VCLSEVTNFYAHGIGNAHYRNNGMLTNMDLSFLYMITFGYTW